VRVWLAIIATISLFTAWFAPALGAAGFTSTLEHLSEYAMRDRLLTIGIVGTIVSAICCFTPILVFLLGAAGLSAAVGYLDIGLIPALAIFLAITGYALWRRKNPE
jgi:mercuric ion transport protein